MIEPDVPLVIESAARRAMILCRVAALSAFVASLAWFLFTQRQQTRLETLAMEALAQRDARCAGPTIPGEVIVGTFDERTGRLRCDGYVRPVSKPKLKSKVTS